VRYIFFILAAFFYLFGLGSCMAAKSSINEIAGILLTITGTLFLIGGGIVEAINEVRNEVRKPHQ